MASAHDGDTPDGRNCLRYRDPSQEWDQGTTTFGYVPFTARQDARLTVRWFHDLYSESYPSHLVFGIDPGGWLLVLRYAQGPEPDVVLVDPGEGMVHEVAPSFAAFQASLFDEIDGIEPTEGDDLEVRLIGMGGVPVVP